MTIERIENGERFVSSIGGYGLADCLRATTGTQSVMENALGVLTRLPGRVA